MYAFAAAPRLDAKSAYYSGLAYGGGFAPRLDEKYLLLCLSRCASSRRKICVLQRAKSRKLRRLTDLLT